LLSLSKTRDETEPGVNHAQRSAPALRFEDRRNRKLDMNLNQIGLMGMGVTMIIGGVFIHTQLGRFFDQQTKKDFDNPELQQSRASRIQMIRTMEGVLLLAGVGLVVGGWLVGHK